MTGETGPEDTPGSEADEAIAQTLGMQAYVMGLLDEQDKALQQDLERITALVRAGLQARGIDEGDLDNRLRERFATAGQDLQPGEALSMVLHDVAFYIDYAARHADDEPPDYNAEIDEENYSITKLDIAFEWITEYGSADMRPFLEILDEQVPSGQSVAGLTEIEAELTAEGMLHTIDKLEVMIRSYLHFGLSRKIEAEVTRLLGMHDDNEQITMELLFIAADRVQGRIAYGQDENTTGRIDRMLENYPQHQSQFTGIVERASEWIRSMAPRYGTQREEWPEAALNFPG